MTGFLNIDKPLGMTSHDVVNRVRRAMGTKQVGHAGTLDPLATGVLIVCVGAATRLSEYVMSETKAYRAVVHLGVETDTYDAEGQVLSTADTSAITREQVDRALDAFRGDIQQIPPMYSAIKQDGRKLYELARKGQTVDVPPRAVTIHSIDILDWRTTESQQLQVTLDISCTAGTYIRSIAHDLGAALGVGAHLAALSRTASGSFRLAQATPLDTLVSSEDKVNYLIAPAAALANHPSMRVDAAQIADLVHGRAIDAGDAEAVNAAAAVIMAYDETDRLVAVLAHRDGRLHPHKVFPPTG